MFTVLTILTLETITLTIKQEWSIILNLKNKNHEIFNFSLISYDFFILQLR